MDKEKITLIVEGVWQNVPWGGEDQLGKLMNSSKPLFLELAIENVQDVPKERDGSRITYARNTMIRCGMSLDLDGTWNVGQLFPHFGGEDVQNIG